MSSGISVKELRYYTRSNQIHNRQIVALLSDDSEYRFSEGKMREEIAAYELDNHWLRIIEQEAYNKAIRFSDKERDWPKIQTLLCEFQYAVEATEVS